MIVLKIGSKLRLLFQFSFPLVFTLKKFAASKSWTMCYENQLMYPKSNFYLFLDDCFSGRTKDFYPKTLATCSQLFFDPLTALLAKYWLQEGLCCKEDPSEKWGLKLIENFQIQI